MKPKITLRTIVISAVLIAIAVIFNRFLGINTPLVQISFNFIPIAMISILFGPVWGGVCAALADLIGAIIFPFGAYFFPFTISAFIMGFFYGIFLYQKEITLRRISIVTVLIAVVVELILGTIWLMIITEKGFWAIFSARLIKIAIAIPLQIFVLYWVNRLLSNYSSRRW